MSKPVDDIMEALAEGMLNGTIKSACVISNGAPCLCGPGFCASERGLGYYGYCNGSRSTAAPDCPLCGAPFQSDAGCWACRVAIGNAPGHAQVWVRMLKAGIHGDALFDEQRSRRAKGDLVTLEQLLDERGVP